MLTQFWDGYITGYNLERLRSGAMGRDGTVLNLDGFVNGRRVAIGDTLITYQCRATPDAAIPIAAAAALDGFLRDAARPVADHGSEAAGTTALNQLAVTITGRDQPCTDLAKDDDGPDGTREGAEHVLLGAVAGLKHARPVSARRSPAAPGFGEAEQIAYAQKICLANKDDVVSLAFVAEAVGKELDRHAKRQP